LVKGVQFELAILENNYTGKYKKMAEEFRRDGCDEYIVEKFIRQEMEADEFAKKQGPKDLEALKLWRSYPKKAKLMWLNNAFCINCGVTSFKNGYNLRKDKFSVVIEGHCSKCGGKIARCCVLV